MSNKTVLVSKDGVKMAGASVILPVVGKVVFDDNGQITVDSDKADSVIEATKGSIDLTAVGSSQDTRNQAMSELELALKDADIKDLLELAKEAPNLNIPPDKIASMSKTKLIKVLVEQEKKMLEGKVKNKPQQDDDDNKPQGGDSDANIGEGPGQDQ